MYYELGAFFTSLSSAQFSVVAGDVVLTRDKSVVPSVSGVELGNDAPLPPTGREGNGKQEGAGLSWGKKRTTVQSPPVDPCHLLGGVGSSLSVAAMQIHGCISA